MQDCYVSVEYSEKGFKNESSQPALLADVIVIIKRSLLATSKMKSTLGDPESKSINFISTRLSSHLSTVLGKQ